MPWIDCKGDRHIGDAMVSEDWHLIYDGVFVSLSVFFDPEMIILHHFFLYFILCYIYCVDNNTIFVYVYIYILLYMILS